MDCDLLCDDARLYCERVTAAGGETTYINEDGLVHGYLGARHTVTCARHSFDRIVEALKAMAPEDDVTAAEQAPNAAADSSETR